MPVSAVKRFAYSGIDQVAITERVITQETQDFEKVLSK